MTEVITRGWGDLAHPIRQDNPGAEKPPWKDNAYVGFWDPGHDVYGVVHVSTSPNAEGRRARASFSVRGHTAEVAETLEPSIWASESINFDLNGRIEVRTPRITAMLDLALRGPYCDYSTNGAVPALVADEPLQHFQGAVLVTGTVAVDGDETSVDGAGIRDRTWGYRDESAQFPEYCAIVLDIDGRMLTIMRFAQPDGGTLTDGFLMSDGEPVLAEQLSGLTRDASGLFAAATVTTAAGDIFDVRMSERRAGFWAPMGWERQGPTMSAYDEFFTFRTSDGRTGYGMVEQGIVRRLS
jgi:hypothetical protein